MKLRRASESKLLVLHTAAGRVGAMDVGAVTEGGMAAALDGAEVIYNLGADEVDIAAGPFVIYQGSHGDRGAHRADIILPAAAYTEENGPVRQHRGPAATGLPRRLPAGRGQGELGDPAGAVGRAGRGAALGQPDRSCAGRWSRRIRIWPRSTRWPENDWQPLPVEAPATAAFRNAVGDFYLTNPIARASALMAELSRAAAARQAPQIAAE